MAPERSMTAAYVDALGPASAIRVGPLPVPGCGPTDVLVEVEAVAVNPVDTYVRSGRFATPVPLPFVVGRDLVGTVVATGSPATPYASGDRVWCNSLGHAGRQGSFAELAVAPADRVYPLPAGVDAETAVGVVHPAGTAFLAWFVHAGLRPGQTVYVGGAAGNVGTAAVAMARRAGARVIAGVRPGDVQPWRGTGTTVAVDFAAEGLADRVREHAPAGVDVVWDTSGRLGLEVAADLVAVGGSILVTAAQPSSVQVPLASVYTRDVSVRGFVISRASVAQLRAAADLVNTMLAAGELSTVVADRLPLAATAEAHQRIEAGGVPGRLIVRP